MALIDRVYEMTQRATVALRINGVLRSDWISMSGGDSDDNPVPYCDVVFPDYTGILRGMAVTLDAGYYNEHIRLFTGGVFARGDEDPDALRTQCYVRGRTDAEGVTIDALASVISPPVVWPPIPAGQYIDFEIADSMIWEEDNAADIAVFELGQQARIPRRPSGEPLKQIVHGLGDLKGAFRSYKIPARDLSGMMLKAAMAGILTDSGVGSWTFDFADYQLAAEGALIDRAPGSQGLGLLMTLRHLKMHQLRSGVVLFRQVDEQPASTAAFTYKSSDVSVARIMDNPSEVRVPFNPLLQKGMTIEIEDEATKIVTSRWYMRGHRWDLGPGGDWSYMDLVGGEDFGSAIGVNPTPQFSYWVDLEYIGGVLTAIVQFDAQASYDGDGTLASGDISWDDNQTPALISGTGFRKRVVVAVADIVEPWEVTATATDSDSLTGTETQTIDTSTTGTAVEIPAIGAASKGHGMYSPDSAGTWYDNAGADNRAVGLRPSDGVHFGHALYGYQDGHLELTRDSNQTQTTVLAAVGSAIKYIAWDWRNTLVAWVLTDDARLYVCINMDAPTPTFGLYGGVGLRTALSRPAAIGRKIGLPAGGNVHVYGGTGTGYPWEAVTTPAVGGWTPVFHIGDILTDCPGDNSLAIRDSTAPGYFGATMILENAFGGGPNLRAIYHTNDPPSGSPSYTRATGDIVGLEQGRAMLPNGPLAAITRIAIFGDAGSERSVFKSTDGIAYTETVDILPATFECHHAMWLSDVLTGLPAFDGIYLLALGNAGTTGGVYKSVDELSTEVQPLRDDASDDPWPSGDVCYQLSIGAPGRTATVPGEGRVAAITTSASPRTVTKLDGSSWSALTAATGITDSNPELFWITPDLVFATNHNGSSADVTGTASRSQDGGATWAANLVGGFGFKRAADGRLWAFSRKTATFAQTEIWWSDDDGDTWNLSTTIGNGTSQLYGALRIACHPTNPNIIAVWGEESVSSGFVTVTTNRGGSWTTTTAAAPDQGQDSVSYTYHFEILANGRFVWAGATSATARSIQTSDTNGASWTVRFSESGSTIVYPGMGVIGSKVVVYRDHTGGTQSGKPLVSNDDALTFALLACDDHQTFTGDASSHSLAAVVDPASDSMYLAMLGTSATYRVLKLSPLTDAGVWSNVTFDIATQSWGNHNLAVIPA